MRPVNIRVGLLMTALRQMTDNDVAFSLEEFSVQEWEDDPDTGHWWPIGFCPPFPFEINGVTTWQMHVCVDRIIESTLFLEDEQFVLWLKWLGLFASMVIVLTDVVKPEEIEGTIDKKIYDRLDGTELLEIASQVQLRALEGVSRG